MKYLFTLFLCLTSVVHMHAQSLSLFDVDASNFPMMKAKFYAFDASGKQQRPSPSEVLLTENGQLRSITSVSCPPDQPPKALSTVLVIDVSGSMEEGTGINKRIELAKTAASAWVTALPLGLSECAVTSFDDNNYINQDFTTNRPNLLKSISRLSPLKGTDYNQALINPTAGGLIISKKGKYQKVIVLLTDGLGKGSEPAIIAEANRQNCIIYCVTIGMPAPDILKNIAARTGGFVFENVTSVQEAQEIYQKILQVAQSASVCDMTWQSVVCEADSKINVESTWQGKSAQSTYIPPSTSIASLNVSPAFTVFGIQAPTSSTDKTITLTAQNADFTVTGITATFGSPDITVVNTNFPLLIPKNTNVSVTLRFIPSDSSIKYTGFEITSDKCPAFFSAKGGIPWGKLPNPTIKLISPNGGETFVAGSDTLITWDSIPKSDTVTLEYSSNNGITWNTITTTGTDLHYLWKNIPLPASNQCKIRVKQLSPNSGTSSKIGSLLFSLPGFSDRLVDVSWSPDGTKVASSFWNQDVLVWDALTGSKIYTLQGHTPPVSSVSWSPDGTRIVTVSRDVNVNFWNAATGAKLYSIPVSNDCKTPIWSPDSKKFVTASNDTFFVWSADFGYKILTVKCGLEVINDIKVVKWSPDGTKIAVGFSNPGGCYSPELPDSASVWSATTGKKLFALNGHLCGFGNRDPSGIQSLNWSPDGSKIATGGVDHSAIIWSGVTGAKLFTLTAHGYPVGVVSWSPDGTKVATASFNYGVSNDGVVIVWSATSGAMHYALRDHYGEISGISWNPEGTKIATASHDKSVIIWSAANGAKLLYFKAFIPGYGSGNKDYGAHWSPDGTRIAIGGDSSATNIWLVDDLPTTLQEDESDAVFSIVAPKAESKNIDLKQCLVNAQKDTMVASFVNEVV